MSSILLPFRLFVKVATIRYLLAAIALVNLLAWGLVIWQVPHQPSINLHYTVYFGIDRIGPWWQSLFFPLGGLLILVVDFMGAWIFAKKLLGLGVLLLVVGLFAQLLILLQTSIVVILNT